MWDVRAKTSFLALPLLGSGGKGSFPKASQAASVNGTVVARGMRRAHGTSVMALADVCFPKATGKPHNRGLEEKMLSSRQRSLLSCINHKGFRGSAFPLAQPRGLTNELSTLGNAGPAGAGAVWVLELHV